MDELPFLGESANGAGKEIHPNWILKRRTFPFDYDGALPETVGRERASVQNVLVRILVECHRTVFPEYE